MHQFAPMDGVPRTTEPCRTIRWRHGPPEHRHNALLWRYDIDPQPELVLGF